MKKNNIEKKDIFNKVQSSVFLATIATYVLIVSGISENIVMQITGIVLSVLSTLLEILSHMLGYDEKATQHWKSAQMYSELYRKCQFFCSEISTDDIISNRCVHLIEHVRKGFFRVSSTPHSLIFRQKDQRFSFFKYNFFKDIDTLYNYFQADKEPLYSVAQFIHNEIQNSKK